MADQRIIKELKEKWELLNEDVAESALHSGRKPKDIKIIAVSKTHPQETIKAAIDAGIDRLGENYAMEMRDKYEYINGLGIKHPEWHFIGHLQTNKVKFLAPFVTMIQSVDSLKIAREISEQAEKNMRTIDILLQVNTSGEDSKSGCGPEEVLSLADSISGLKNISLRGFMTIGSFSEDEKVIRREFNILKKCREEANNSFPGLQLNELSMGMSHDYRIAIEEGATIIRVGTAIFGYRSYSH